MIFGEIPVAEAAGTILAHGFRLGGLSFKKGRRLSPEDAAALAAAGRATVVAARLEPGDVDENAAAAALATAAAGARIGIGSAFTGRVNLFAASAGICVFDRARVDRINRVDETLTIATLEPYGVVQPKQMVATIKVIPFAVPRTVVETCAGLAGGAEGPLLRIAPFIPTAVGLIQTRLPGLKDSVLDKTVETTRGRLEALSGSLIFEARCDHRSADLAPQIAAALAAGCGLVLIAGASAIVDRRDVIPAAITRERGTIEHFGMPVDPGNLMLMGRIGTVPVLGLPGCARSPKVNGFDWVLQRLMAGLPAGPAEIMGMGVGGLLADIPSRPLPRAQASREAVAPAAPRAPRIAALVLAAGQSRRMGTLNKLVIEIDGKPMVGRVVEAVAGSEARPILVVTGHEHERVEAALQGFPVSFAFNPDYAEGLSTSLGCGLAALPAEIDGALVCLGDMPRVTAAEIDRLIAAFNPVEGRAICVPTRRGKRGNPVLWAKRFFPEMRDVAGDVGARHLIGTYPELVVEVEMASDGILTDIDTPQALARITRSAAI